VKTLLGVPCCGGCAKVTEHKIQRIDEGLQRMRVTALDGIRTKLIEGRIKK
jgi:hypothetical protein